MVERRAGVLSARPPTGKSATPDGGRKACEGVQMASGGQERALALNVDARLDGRWMGEEGWARCRRLGTRRQREVQHGKSGKQRGKPSSP